MEDQREDVDAFLAHLAEKFEMKDLKPYEIASVFSFTMYEEFTRSGIGLAYPEARIKFKNIDFWTEADFAYYYTHGLWVSIESRMVSMLARNERS
jgi:hypothetical protein